MTLGVDFLTKKMYIKELDSVINFNIWDTAGQEYYDSLTRRYFKGSDICIIAFSITNRESFLKIPKWKEKIKMECGYIPILIVMTKIDLIEQAEVTIKEAIDFCSSMKIEMIMTSSKNDLKIEELFNKAAHLFVKEYFMNDEEEEIEEKENENNINNNVDNLYWNNENNVNMSSNRYNYNNDWYESNDSNNDVYTRDNKLKNFKLKIINKKIYNTNDNDNENNGKNKLLINLNNTKKNNNNNNNKKFVC